jgi:hypothetical protein
MNDIELERIADKSKIFLLEQFDCKHSAFLQLKEMIKRKICGDNPTHEEWTLNATVNEYEFEINCDIPESYGYTISRHYTNNSNNDEFLLRPEHKNKMVDYIISLLGDKLIQFTTLEAISKLERHLGTCMADAVRSRLVEIDFKSSNLHIKND